MIRGMKSLFCKRGLKELSLFSLVTRKVSRDMIAILAKQQYWHKINGYKLAICKFRQET